MAFIGNDIISLSDKKNQASFSRPRYLKKVLCSYELDVIRKNPNLDFLPFLKWTCKETAYKIAVKSGFRKSFCPSDFRVTLAIGQNQNTVQSAVLGKTIHKGNVVYTKSIIDSSYIHTVGTDVNIISLDFISEVRQLGPANVDNQSANTRDLFIHNLAETLNLDKSDISISSDSYTGIPKVLFKDKPLEVDLSFSHDGEFVSYSYLFW